MPGRENILKQEVGGVRLLSLLPERPQYERVKLVGESEPGPCWLVLQKMSVSLPESIVPRFLTGTRFVKRAQECCVFVGEITARGARRTSNHPSREILWSRFRLLHD